MADDTRNAFDAVDEGPLPSEAPGATVEPSTSDPAGHFSVAALLERFGSAVIRHKVNAGDQWVVWIDPSRNLEILSWLKDDPDHWYDMMSDVTGVDYGGGRPVEVVYQMLSTRHKRALRVRCPLPISALEIDSVANLWRAADWLEREVYDLFGVTFKGHPDLRRILMPSDYAEGHPLRKDFPLRGRFTRAEQTRRALAQDVERFYAPDALSLGGDPQEVLVEADRRRAIGPASEGEEG